jgi:uncharacterized protein (DUF433 family)
MALSLTQMHIPLTLGEDGVTRVGNTDLTLETVVTEFEEGAIPDDIVNRHPGVHLADLYSVLSFYLSRRRDVETYLQEREAATNLGFI